MTLWLVRAGKHGEREELALENDIAVIGWDELPDLSGIATAGVDLPHRRNLSRGQPQDPHELGEPGVAVERRLKERLRVNRGQPG